LVALKDAEFVPEEASGLRAGVGDQGLGFRQLELEGLAQKRLELGLDRLRFRPRSGEAEQEVG
jgi:hypothetical protein